MKKSCAVMLLAVAVAAPSFASDVVGHSAKAAGKDSAKAVAYSGKEVGKAGKSLVKALF
jgi:opacity protein-like surface antigen